MLAANQIKAMNWIKKQLFDELNIKDLRQVKVIIK